MTPFLSVVIITFNVEKVIQACLNSVIWADEIIIVDSGSTDLTLSLAAKYPNVKSIHQDWLGFGLQKQFAVKQAKHDWVLCLDADEWLNSTLADNIKKLVATFTKENQNSELMAYDFARSNQFLGRYLRYGEGYPDYSLRLFHRKYANWSDHTVHEFVICRSKVGRIQGDLMHQTGWSVFHYLSKQNDYTSLQAQQFSAKSQSQSSLIFKILFSPLFRFVKFYGFKRGFLDGVPGLVHILIGCFNTFIKYVKLYEINQKNQINKRK
ncbi:MAG: glycosyltransferase family 2 protein [Neisseriaceae bacterium]|nr:glycosyltransferase family 2 protein [Neisseriaceae bacterium]